MSEVAEKTLWGPNPGWGRPPVPGTRPPSGAWPPCPPGPPGPGLSGLFRLEQCWQDVAQAKVVLKKMIADIIAEDPTFIKGVGVAGVTDGQPAQPGQVGEMHDVVGVTAPVPVAATTQAVPLGVLPPGDWDVWVTFTFSSAINDLATALTPLPAGFDGAMVATTLSRSGLMALSPVVAAVTSVPSLVVMSVTTNAIAAGPAAATMTVSLRARRMR